MSLQKNIKQFIKINISIFTIVVCLLMVCKDTVHSQVADSVIASNLYSKAYDLGLQLQNDSSNLLLDSLIKNYVGVLRSNPDLASIAYNLSFTTKLRLGDQEGMQRIWREGLQFMGNLDPPEYDGMARLYMGYAGQFNTDIQMDSILAYLDPAEKLLSKVTGKSRTLTLLYYQKSRLAYNYSDYDGQISYALKGLDYQSKHFSDNNLMRMVFCNTIGIGYRNMQDLVNAEKYFQAGLATEARNPPERSIHASIGNNLGLVFLNRKKYDQAIECISNSITYYRNFISPTDLEIGSGYDNIGRCYRGMGKLDKAEEYFRKALAFMKKNLPPNHRDVLLPYLSLGKLHQDNAQLDSAEYYYSLGLDVISHNGWSRSHPGGDFIMEDAFEIFGHLITLRKKQYDTSRDTSYLHLAMSTMEDFINTTDYAFQHYNSTASIENYFRAYESIYGDALSCLTALQKLRPNSDELLNAVTWVEKFKAMELRYAFQRSKVEFSDDYRLLNTRQQQLEDSLRHIETLVANTQNTSDSLIFLANQAKHKLYLWKQSIKKEYPNYYSLIYNNEIPAFDFQKLLRANQSAVIYKLGKQSLFTLVINQKDISLKEIPFPDSIFNMIDDWRRVINKFGDAATYDDKKLNTLLDTNNRLARILYRHLIEPIQNHLHESILIIPDDALGYLPFGALLSSSVHAKDRIKEYPYLIKKHALTYCYSLDLYREMYAKQVQPSKKMLAVAPNYVASDAHGFQSLAYNDNEAESIAALFDGATITKDFATRESFIAQSPDYQIIHLAAHGKANNISGERSFLVYSGSSDSTNNRLYTGDIYNLSLQAELVSLSACETGIGHIQRGEGIISLARAFSFAGAKSVMSTLWNVNDKNTAKLMTKFYSLLKKGISKDKSLQHAILNYLQTSTQVEAHPYYWSGFIPIGDPRPLSSSPTKYMMYILLSVLAGVLLLFVWKKVA